MSCFLRGYQTWSRPRPAFPSSQRAQEVAAHGLAMQAAMQEAEGAMVKELKGTEEEVEQLARRHYERAIRGRGRGGRGVPFG